MPEERCPWTIKFGVTLHTRCSLPVEHLGNHEGRGLREFPYQKIEWLSGDRREYRSASRLPFAWEEDQDA
jgi:hypothetical protein